MNSRQPTWGPPHHGSLWNDPAVPNLVLKVIPFQNTKKVLHQWTFQDDPWFLKLRFRCWQGPSNRLFRIDCPWSGHVSRPKDIAPNVHIYNSAISACHSRNLWGKVYELFLEMERVGVPRDVESISIKQSSLRKWRRTNVIFEAHSIALAYCDGHADCLTDKLLKLSVQLWSVSSPSVVIVEVQRFQGC